MSGQTYTHTHIHTYTHTHTYSQDNYYNPRCAHAHRGLIILKTEKTFKNEQRSKDAAAKKRPNTSGVGKINNYYEDIYIPPYNNTE